MRNVLHARLRLEALEARLPPGEWFLGATFAWSLVGQDFPLRTEVSPPKAIGAALSILAAPGSQRSVLVARHLRALQEESQNADPRSTVRIAFTDPSVRDLFENGACLLPRISDPLARDALRGQEQEENNVRGARAANSSLGSTPASVREFFASNAPALGSVVPEGPGQVKENYSGMIPPSAENSAGLNSVVLASLTALRKGGTLAAPGSNRVATFVFVDRPDARADENYGLVPDTFGFASGLLVRFDVSQGQLGDPQVVAAPSQCGEAATEVLEEKSVFVDFGQACALPASPGVSTGVENQVTLQMDADPSAEITPSEITWLAPIHNVVPRRLSSETNFDSEPSLAVNPAGGTIALTTFSGSWSPKQGAPLWVSGTEGRTWDQRFGIPQPEAGAYGPLDQTIAYDQDGSVLYGTFLGGNRFLSAYVRATPDPLTSDFGGTFVSSGGVDQPWIQIGSVDPETSLDRVYLSVNDQSHLPASASVLVSNDGGAIFQEPVRLERGTAVVEDHPPRVAVRGNRVYGAFLRRTGTPTGVEGPGEVVVVRDDQGGLRGPANPNPFGVLGQGVVLQSGSYPTSGFLLGQQRIGGDLSLAIDPHDPDTVYLSFSRIENHQPVLYVHRSQDGGNTWQDLLAIDNAAIGNLAVADNGTWGLLNVRVEDGRMFQEFRQNGGEPTVLSSWPVNDPRGGRVYVGDYQSLVAVGRTFYAGFCASNFPDLANFPSGVVYQRNADFPGHHLLTMEGRPVVHSIDPFFFHQDASDPGANDAKRR